MRLVGEPATTRNGSFNKLFHACLSTAVCEESRLLRGSQTMPMSASVKLLCVAAVSAIAYLLGRRACTRQVEEAVEHAVDGAAVRPWFPKSDTTLQCPTRGEYILGMSREEMKAELEAFVAVYRRAPKIDQFGSGFFHYFALWTAIRKLRPVHVIESGVLRGVGSWFCGRRPAHTRA